MGRFLKCDGLCPFLIIKGYQNLIIVQVNRIDKRIHQRLPLIFQAHVQLTETEQPEPDKLFGYFRLCQLFFCNTGLKLTLGFFELLQPLLGGTGEDSGLNRIEHILDTGFRITKLFLIERNVGILLILQFHHLGDDRFHGGIVLDKLHRLVDYQIFQPLFTDSLFLAALVLFGSSTFIIAVDFTRPACAALSKHQRPTVAAEQLGGEQIVVLCLSTGRGFLVFGDLLLHILKQFQRNDGRDSIRLDHIPEFQFSDVPPVFEHKRTVKPTPDRIGKLVNIQAKLKQGKGIGYERWAKKHNLKAMAQTLILLEEKGLTDEDALNQRIAELETKYHDSLAVVKDLEGRMKANKELRYHIAAHTNTKNIAQQLKTAKRPAAFEEQHRAELTAHRAAAAYFKANDITKLPSPKKLEAEYAQLASEKAKFY